jgi:hypothetical protein
MYGWFGFFFVLTKRREDWVSKQRLISERIFRKLQISIPIMQSISIESLRFKTKHDAINGLGVF